MAVLYDGWRMMVMAMMMMTGCGNINGYGQRYVDGVVGDGWMDGWMDTP